MFKNIKEKLFNKKQPKNINEIKEPNVTAPAVMTALGYLLGFGALIVAPGVGRIIIYGTTLYFGYKLYKLIKFEKLFKKLEKNNKKNNTKDKKEKDSNDKNLIKKLSKFKKKDSSSISTKKEEIKESDETKNKSEVSTPEKSKIKNNETSTKQKQINELKELKTRIVNGEYSFKKDEIHQDKVNLNEICDYYKWNNTNPSYNKEKVKTKKAA